MSMFKDGAGFVVHLPEAEVPEACDVLFDPQEQEHIYGGEFATLLEAYERLERESMSRKDSNGVPIL